MVKLTESRSALMRSGVMPQPASPSFQVVACCSANASGVSPAFCASPSLIHGRKSAGVRSGNVRQRLVRSPLGSISRQGTPAVSASSIEHHAEAGLPGARHADDHAMGREVTGPHHRRGAGALVRGRIDQLAEVEVSHGGDCRSGRRDHWEAAPDGGAGRRSSRRYRSRR